MASVSGTNVVESSNNSSNTTTTNNNNNNNLANVPQWKRDLIQRRKQQNKVSTNNNGANTKLCTTTTTASNNGVIANDASNMVKIIDSCTSKHEMTEENMSSSNRIDNNNDTCDLVERSVTSSASCTATTTTTTRESSSSSSSSTPPLPLTTTSTATTSTTTIITKDTQLNVNESVACKMRFEADVSVCPSSEDTPKTTTTSTTTTLTKSLLLTERNNLQDYNNFDSDYKDNIICHNKHNNNTMDNNKDSGGGGVCVYAEFKKGWDKTTTTTTGKIDDKIKNQNHHINNNNHHCIIDDNKKIKLIKKNGDECESDSSEELQYGPGIVNRLKSKYLNLTLREMNKSRVSVQRFRRAASLEDLLDCDDHDDDGVDDNDNNNDENDKLTRKFTKKPLIPGIINKTDRYRNATRGNESMKRARSVEALMRCQNHDDTNQNSRFIGVRQEPVNDHIVLVDRATVKIESRLIGNIIDNDRPKALNKPKRIKPLLADTERPPPDLVKTTMRIFEGSVRKLKLKGDVAAKVATFKTINDTYKAQTVKKIVPKPPIQPKPFTNNNNNNININKQPSSPKKNISSQLSKPITAELIENPLIHEEYKNDGVVTDPIVQSVSSVVSKFQQIGKSINSPSSSPEPIYNKLKSSLSPISSPEPPFINNNNHHHQNNNSNHNNNHHHHKQKINNDAGIGFNKSTSPVTSPSSPKKNLPRQNIILTQSASVSPVHEIFRTNNNSTLESLVKAQPEILISEETVIEETDKQPENRRQQVLEDKILPPIIHDEIIEEEKNEEANKHVKELNEEIINKQDIIEDIIDDVEAIDGPKTISKSALDSISKAGCTMEFNFNTETSIKKSYLPGTMQNGNSSESTQNGNIEELKNNIDKKLLISNDIAGNCGDDDDDDDDDIKTDKEKINETPIILDNIEIKKNDNEIIKPSIGAISSLGMIKSSSTTMSYSQLNESKLIKNQKTDLPPQKQIGIIRPLVSTKTQLPQQNLSSRELEKNLINRVKSIEQPTKVVVSLKSADEIQPVKKTGSSGSGGGGLWDTKPWNQQNNTMVFNFSNRKDVPDYIENDGLIISRKREKSKVGDGGIIVLDATLDASTTDDNDWDNSEGPPSPCDIKFTNDNILINGRSNLSRSPRNHKHRIQFNDQATRTFEYPSESSMLEDIGSTSCVDGETSGVGDHQQSTQIVNKSISPTVNSASVSPILGGGGLSNFTPSKVDLTSEGFELGVTRTLGISSTSQSTPIRDGNKKINDEEAMNEEEDCLQNSQDTAAWGAEATADLLY